MLLDLKNPFKKSSYGYGKVKNKTHYISAADSFIERCYSNSNNNKEQTNTQNNLNNNSSENYSEMYKSRTRRNGVAEMSEDERTGLKIILKRHILNNKIDEADII